MRIGIHAVGLLVVGGEVLDTCSDVVLLYTENICGSSSTRHHGILRIILEVTSAERVAHDVDGRGQQHIGTILLHFLTNGLSDLLDELCVPGRSQQRSYGEVGAIVGCRVPLSGSIDAQSRGSVSQYHGRDAQRVEGIGGASGSRHEAHGCAYHSIVARESGHPDTDYEVSFVFE